MSAGRRRIAVTRAVVLLVAATLTFGAGRVAAPPVPAADIEPEQTFAAANRAYEEGRYGEAAALYEGLLARGLESSDLYFDLGNARLRNGELGRAIAAYLSARRLAPRDRDVAANLEFARQKAGDALRPPGPSPLEQALCFWHYRTSRREMAWALLVLNGVFWGLLSLLLVAPGRDALRWAAGLVLVLALAAAGSLAVRTWGAGRVAVVLPRRVAAHSGTREDSVVRFELQAGAEIRVVEEREAWVRIALPDGQQGWLPREAVTVVASG